MAPPEGEAATSTVVVDGAPLTCAAVTAAARREARMGVGELAVAAARAAWQTGRDLAARQPVYGRNTGVRSRPVSVGWRPVHGGDLAAGSLVS